MFIKLEVLLLSAFFCIIILLGGGIWIGTAMTENLYVDLEPNAKTIIEVGSSRYYCQ